MPSSLTMLLPSALGFSPHPPVSVYGTGAIQTIAAFLAHGSHSSLLFVRYASRLRIAVRICQYDSYLACAGLSIPGCALTRVPTVLYYRGTGISTCCPSVTSFDLALGPTYPEQISFTLETLDIRPEGFSPSSRYSFRHSLFYTVHSSLSVLLLPVYNAPLPMYKYIPELR